MIDGFITSVGDKIKAALQATIGQWLSLDWIPEIFFWYWWLFVFMLICGALIWLSRLFDFEPMKWLRFLIGAAILLAIAFVAGGRKMYNDQQAKLKAERDRLKKRPIPKPPSGNGPFGNWGS